MRHPFSNCLFVLMVILVVSFTAVARAECEAPFVPPKPTTIYCMVWNGQENDCTRARRRLHNQEEAAAYRNWQREQIECEAQQRKAEADKRAATERAVEDAERQREAAETARYIAQQRAEAAAAERDRQLAEAEAAKLKAEKLREQVDAAVVQRNLYLAQHPPVGVVLADAMATPLPAKLAWAFLVVPCVGFVITRLKRTLSRGQRFTLFIFLSAGTSLIGYAAGFTDQLTLWEFCLLPLPSGAGVFASIIAKT